MADEAYQALILEDEKELCLHLTTILSRENIIADTVQTVAEAIEVSNSKHFDIVISDIYLPQGNGLEFFQYAQEHHPDLPFVLMTGFPNLEMAVEYLKRGVYDYVSKPFSSEEIITKIHEVLERSRQQQDHSRIIESLKSTLDARLADLAIFRDVFQHQKDGLVILDTDGRIVRINPALEKLSGIVEDQVIDQHFLDFVNGVFPKLDMPTISDSVREDGHWSGETEARHKDGQEWAAHLTYFPIRDQQGQIFAYGAGVSDVSELREVEGALIDSLQQTNSAQEAIIFGLVRLAEYRDRTTGFHLERICIYSKILAEALVSHPAYKDRVGKHFISVLQRAAPLHDIGKVGIPDRILLKAGKLTPGEYEIMRSHTVIGYETLNSIREQFGEMDFLEMGIEIAHAHHEHYNGRGYPNGLKGEEIPLSAQIIALADVYDALTSRRPYKKAFSHEIAINTMKLQRGKQFNPQLFDIFMGLQERFDAVRQEYTDQRPESDVFAESV